MKMPFYSRPSYRLKEKGVSALEDAELLSIILDKGLEECNRLLSTTRLNQFNEENLIEDPQLISLGELFTRYQKLERKGYSKTIERAEDVKEMFIELKSKKKEYFYAVLLDRGSVLTLSTWVM